MRRRPGIQGLQRNVQQRVGLVLRACSTALQCAWEPSARRSSSSSSSPAHAFTYSKPCTWRSHLFPPDPLAPRTHHGLPSTLARPSSTGPVQGAGRAGAADQVGVDEGAAAGVQDQPGGVCAQVQVCFVGCGRWCGGCGGVSRRACVASAARRWRQAAGRITPWQCQASPVLGSTMPSQFGLWALWPAGAVDLSPTSPTVFTIPTLLSPLRAGRTSGATPPFAPSSTRCAPTSAWTRSAPTRACGRSCWGLGTSTMSWGCRCGAGNFTPSFSHWLQAGACRCVRAPALLCPP